MFKTLLMFFGIAVAGILIFLNPLTQLAQLSFRSELYSHFFLIPAVSLYFFFIDRKNIFSEIKYQWKTGIQIMAAALAFLAIGYLTRNALVENDYLSLSIFGFVLWLIGGFIAIFGLKAFRQAVFPLLFLVFMVPIPTFLLDRIIHVLQIGSAHAVQPVFELIRLPYLRNGVVYEVPGGVVIEVAKQCSGIRSSLALVITAVIAGHMFLQKTWTKIVLVLSVLPVTIFKNALRITSLTYLASTLDKSWLTDSWLHKSGGVVYLMIAFAILGPILWGLRKVEMKSCRDRSGPV
ncbi:MAG: exosortase/archaeosortase family protein [Desulfobacterales bacterium]